MGIPHAAFASARARKEVYGMGKVSYLMYLRRIKRTVAEDKDGNRTENVSLVFDGPAGQRLTMDFQDEKEAVEWMKAFDLPLTTGVSLLMTLSRGVERLTGGEYHEQGEP